MCRRFDSSSPPAYNNPIVWFTSSDESSPPDHIVCQNVAALGEVVRGAGAAVKVLRWLSKIPWPD